MSGKGAVVARLLQANRILTLVGDFPVTKVSAESYVLVAGDQWHPGDHMLRFVRRKGGQAFAVESATVANRAMIERHPNCAVLDSKQPGRCGIDLCRRFSSGIATGR